jgi:hypothetical protein
LGFVFLFWHDHGVRAVALIRDRTAAAAAAMAPESEKRERGGRRAKGGQNNVLNNRLATYLASFYVCSTPDEKKRKQVKIPAYIRG